MSRLIWSPAALRDLQRLYRFLADTNPDAAKRAMKAIRQGVRILASQPLLGPPVENMDDTFQEWKIQFGDSGYVVRYRVAADVVIILAARHQKKLWH